MRHFSFRAPLALRGRRRRGLSGLSGKPLHPPLTDVVVGAYVLGAGFDVFSRLLAAGSPGAARELHAGATWLLLAGAAVSLPTALTGLADWRTSKPGTQARRAANAHALVMVTVTLLVLADLAARLADDARTTSTALAALGVVAVVLLALGGAYGGALVYGYGWSVTSTAGAAAWKVDEADVLPDGRRLHDPVPAALPPVVPPVGAGGR